MKVREVMNKTPKFCSLDTNLAAAAELMWTNDCGDLPVLDGTGKVVGVITDRDICIALGTRNRPASEIAVGEVMSRRLFSCAPHQDIHEALKTMQAERVRRLPVLSNAGNLQGILCLNDIVLHAQKQIGGKIPELSYEDVMETLKAICEHRLLQAVAA